MKYQTKPIAPIVVDALQFYPSMPMYQILDFAGCVDSGEVNQTCARRFEKTDTVLVIYTGAGPQIGHAGDWIIRYKEGHCNIVSNEVFVSGFEPVAALSQAEKGK